MISVLVGMACAPKLVKTQVPEFTRLAFTTLKKEQPNCIQQINAAWASADQLYLANNEITLKRDLLFTNFNERLNEMILCLIDQKNFWQLHYEILDEQMTQLAK